MHRVIQEAITNCVKHAPGAAITVRVRGGDAIVEVEVHNPAAPTAPTPTAGLGQTGGGHGLAGMRERVHRNGGHFQAGPDGDGGWGVSVQLPRREWVSAS